MENPSSMRKLFLLLSIFCGSAFAIEGGSRVSSENSLSRSIVNLVKVIPNIGRVQCTATFVAEDLLVTAAHCLSYKDSAFKIDPEHPEFFFVHLGSWTNFSTTSVPSAWAPVTDVRVHEDFHLNKDHLEHDVALLKIDSRFLKEKPLAIPMANSPINTNLVIAGFGPTSATNAFILRSIRAKIRNKNESASFFNVSFLPVARHKGYVGLNHGDSGGPAFAQEKNGKSILLGIDSGGDLYQSIPAHYQWIIEAAASMGRSL